MGTIKQPSNLHAHGQRTVVKTRTSAYNPYATQYGQQSWNQPQTATRPANWGFGAGALVGLLITTGLALTSNAYVTGIFAIVTLLLTAITHYTARTQTQYQRSWSQRW